MTSEKVTLCEPLELSAGKLGTSTSMDPSEGNFIVTFKGSKTAIALKEKYLYIMNFKKNKD